MSAIDVLGFNYANPSIPKAVNQPQPYPYTSSITSSASSSASSVFSVDCISSQSSTSSSNTSVDMTWENEFSGKLNGAAKISGTTGEENCNYNRAVKGCGAKVTEAAVASELRQHPRRTSHAAANGTNGSAPTRQPPSLVRQCERKVSFVDSLVDSASQIIETIWPLSVVAPRSDSSLGSKGVLPLRTFIQETLRRSRTSYSTLQVALYYLILIKPHVPKIDFTMEQPRAQPCSRAMQCGRRMFLAALILASKYLQDRNYSARAWSKISGLNTSEINQNELIFLQVVEWKLHISEQVFQRWTDIVLKYTPTNNGSSNGEGLCWRTIVPQLTPELDVMDSDAHIDWSSAQSKHQFGSDGLSPRNIPVSPPMASANDQTPTCARNNVTLNVEPNSSMDYSNVTLPSLPKLGLLPTPQMTPQSNATSIPAASTGGRRPSICSALSQAQNMSIQRTTLDQRPAPMYISKQASHESFSASGRRSSLARSSSSASSPESMVSDVPSLSSSQSSRSSRSSSISSVASGTCAPAQTRLAIRATRRCANLQPNNCLKDGKKNLVISTPIDEHGCPEMFASPEPLSAGGINVPDLSNFSLGTPVELSTSTQEAAQGLCELSGALPRQSYPVIASNDVNSLQATTAPANTGRRCRKRGRPTSDDFSLQNRVRHLISHGTRRNEEDRTDAVLPDSQIADSFLIPHPKAPQSPSACPLGTTKLPIPLSLPNNRGSLKRTCCGKEAIRFLWGIDPADATSSSSD